MNYDVTLTLQSQPARSASASADIARVEDHVGVPIARTIRLRQAASACLHQLANLWLRARSRPSATSCSRRFPPCCPSRFARFRRSKLPHKRGADAFILVELQAPDR